MIQYGTKHCEIVPSSDVISIEPDLCLLREGGSPGEVIFVNQLYKSLRRRGLLHLQPSDLAENFLVESHLSSSVDHGIGDDPGLSECRSKGESGEDVPGGGELVLAGGGEVVGGCGDSGGGERLWGDGQHEGPVEIYVRCYILGRMNQFLIGVI